MLLEGKQQFCFYEPPPRRAGEKNIISKKQKAAGRSLSRWSDDKKQGESAPRSYSTGVQHTEFILGGKLSGRGHSTWRYLGDHEIVVISPTVKTAQYRCMLRHIQE